MDKLSYRLRQRFWNYPLIEIIREFDWKQYFRIATARDTTPLRKPAKQSVSYRFRARACDEERRQFKLLDGEVEEYTKIEKGFYPALGKVSNGEC